MLPRRSVLLAAAGAATLLPQGRLVGSARAQAAPSSISLAVDVILTLDPAHSRATGGNLSVLSQVYSALTTLDENGQLVGDLATAWEQTGPLEFTFKLRDDAAFENGKALDANVVAWNFTRMMDPAIKATANTDFNLIQKVTAVDPTTLVITTKSPWIDLPRRLSWMFMLEPEWTAANNPKVEVNASGAYRVESYEPGSSIVLRRNDRFHGPKPAIEKVTYRTIGNSATRIAGLRSGELDGTIRIDPIDMAQLQRLDDYNTGARAAQRYHVLKFHFGRKPLADIRVRQAINYGINKEAITKAVFRGMVGPGTTQVLNPETPGFNQDYKPWPYDKAKARQLLVEAGYGDGLELSMSAPSEGSIVGTTQAVQVIASQLAEIGITIKIFMFPDAAWLALRGKPDTGHDLSYAGYVSQSNTAVELFGQYSSKGPLSFGPFPPAFDQALAAAQAAATPDEQLVKIREASAAMLDDVLITFLYFQPQTYAIKKTFSWQTRSDDWVKAADIKLA